MRMGFMTLVTAMVLRQVSVLSVSVRRVYAVFSTADLRVEESRALRHVKPPCCRQATVSYLFGLITDLICHIILSDFVG